MNDESERRDLMMAVAASWGIWSGTTDSQLDEIASQLLTEVRELRDELPLSEAPIPDIVGMNLSDAEGWRREVTIHRHAAHAATELVQLLNTRPEDWPEQLRLVLVTQTRRHGRPALVALVDALTRIATPALVAIADQSGQQLPELLQESLPWLQPQRQ